MAIYLILIALILARFFFGQELPRDRRVVGARGRTIMRCKWIAYALLALVLLVLRVPLIPATAAFTVGVICLGHVFHCLQRDQAPSVPAPARLDEPRP